MCDFPSLGVNGWLTRQCQEMGITKPTEIQQHCIPQILAGNDCVGCAKTGSGKTASFAIPIIQKLSEDPYGIFALVLTPTRELAFQIGEQFRALGSSMNLKYSVVVGGMDMVAQGRELSEKPHIVIATPGRLAGHFNEGGSSISMKKIRFLVLDEADRLLEKSFEKDLEVIFGNISEKRQTLIFSATLTDTINQLQTTSKNLFTYRVESDTATVSQLDQRYLLIPSLVKDAYLIHLLRNFIDTKSVIIFTHTCRSCQVLAYLLKKLEMKCVALHSLMPQRRRLNSLAQFKTGVAKVLIATDVASRGLDIPLVQLVLNYNVPASPTDYIHRVGRTARAGRGGMSVTLLTQYDIERLKAIEEHVHVKMTEFETSENDALKLLKVVSVARREVEIRLNDSSFGEKRQINKRKAGIPTQEKKTSDAFKRRKKKKLGE